MTALDLTAVRLAIPGAADRRARPWLPLAARPGQVWIGPDGDAVRIGEGGTVDEVDVRLPHRRSAASCPSNARRTT